MIEEYLAGLRCAWIFNVEYAPWWGGAFERMVKSTKRCLRKMIGRAQLTLDELLTAFVEIEAVINSRPLSYVSGEDVEESLTPSHLLVGRRILSLLDHIIVVLATQMMTSSHLTLLNSRDAQSISTTL